MTAYLSFVERRCIPSFVIGHQDLKNEKESNHNIPIKLCLSKFIDFSERRELFGHSIGDKL
jgi:hypothetical protein